ncbi:MAG TPA: TIGR02450 family Trp-rich protein [Methylophilus sp.]
MNNRFIHNAMTKPLNASKLNPKKLLHSKWTAVHPSNKEKHFMVTKVIKPAQAQAMLQEKIEWVELEAVYTQRVQLVRWQTLMDSSVWVQGW